MFTCLFKSICVFCFSYTNFSHFSMTDFFYNKKNTIFFKKTMMYLIMYIKYTHQLRSTFNCYFPYVKGHFWQGNQLLLSIFLIISSIMFIFVCSNLIEVIIGHNAEMYSTSILAEMLLRCWVTQFFFSILKILLYVARIFIMSQILLE